MVDRFSPILPAPQGEVKTKSINKSMTPCIFCVLVSMEPEDMQPSVKGVLLDACPPEEVPKNKYKMAHNLPPRILSYNKGTVV